MRSNLAAVLNLYGFSLAETGARPDKKSPELLVLSNASCSMSDWIGCLIASSQAFDMMLGDAGRRIGSKDRKRPGYRVAWRNLPCRVFERNLRRTVQIQLQGTGSALSGHPSLP